jgi:spermidine synthase
MAHLEKVSRQGAAAMSLRDDQSVSQSAEEPPPSSDGELGAHVAAGLVFGASAAVLVVELAMLRLLAPYLGLTLETSTLVIGMALTAIAVGSWAGGRMADVLPPRRTLAPLLALSGVAVALSPVLVRVTGSGGHADLLLLTAALAIFVPGAALSAVTPIVTKMRLTSLHETGTVVGRLSAIGTSGAIAGTVLTGFVLITHVPVSGILVGLGVLLVLASVAVGAGVRRLRTGAVAGAVVLLGGIAAAAAPGGCDAETTYHCASVLPDPDRIAGRTLVLDGVPHSYVDLDDPTYLHFEYVQAIASVVDTSFPTGEALRAYHLGGGGLTLPHYLDRVRPGTDSVVSEIDGGVVRIDRERLGLETGDGIEVRVEDGRLGLERLQDESRDLVVGDAFGGMSVPWHLTTREAMTEVRRVLAAEGRYVANLIDYGPLAFARSAAATLRDQFRHVALTAEPDTLAREGGGNLVLIASDHPINVEAVASRLDDRGTGWEVATGTQLDAWVGDARVLTDDHAPVDQLLTPYREPAS